MGTNVVRKDTEESSQGMLFYFLSETARTETTRAGLQSEQLSVQSGSAGIHNKGLLKINSLCWHWNGLGGDWKYD